jgi:CRP-like cAMP-binding protein
VPAEEPTADPSADTAPPKLTPEQVIEQLGRVNLFGGLPAVYLRRIASLGSLEHHQKGVALFKEGEPGGKVYLILQGAVRISRRVTGMGEETMAVLKAGDYFGEMGIIDDFPRSADATVHEACRLFVITRDNLWDLLFVDRDLAYELLWNFVRTLSGRLRETNDKMTFLHTASQF